MQQNNKVVKNKMILWVIPYLQKQSLKSHKNGKNTPGRNNPCAPMEFIINPS